MSQQHLSEQEEIRRNSLKEMISLGIVPYPSEEFPVNTSSREILQVFDPDGESLQDVCVAGRIMSRRRRSAMPARQHAIESQTNCTMPAAETA